MDKKALTGYPSIDKPWLKYYTEEQINAPLPHMTAYEYLKTQNADRLDSLAIDSEVGNYTYRELFAQIDAAAAALWAMGIQKGKQVLSMFPVLPHESFLFYGIDAVGAALCQLAPQYTALEVCNYANRIDADLFFVFDFILTPEMEQMIYQSTKVRHIIVVNFMPLQGRDERTIAWDAFIAQGTDVILPEIHRDSAKDVLFFASTGGSTGEPKCVMYTDDTFNFAVQGYFQSPLFFFPKQKWLRMWPLFSGAASVANHHMPLCCGMVSVLRSFRESILEFPQVLIAEKPQHLLLIPQIFDVMEQSELLKNQDLSFIVHAGCGGMAITPQFEERVNTFFKQHNVNTFVGYGWGCTESATLGTIRSSFETCRPGTAGVPFVNTVVAAFDTETDEECTYGQEGELCICSPGMMLSYYNAPEQTAKALRIHADGRRWLHTGDLGTVDEDGFVRVSGRMTRMILISANAKIYPAAIEAEITSVPGVQEVVFCAVPKDDGFYTPVCYIVPENMDKAEEIKAAVERFCAMKFPEDSRPKRVFIKDHMPLNKGNKPDILLLEKEAAEAMEG